MRLDTTAIIAEEQFNPAREQIVAGQDMSQDALVALARDASEYAIDTLTL